MLALSVQIKAVSQRGSGRLVDDSLDLQPGDFTGVLGRLPLVVVEVGRDRNHGFADFLPQMRLGVSLDFLQNHRRDFLGRVFLLANLDTLISPHLALDTHDGALGVEDRLPLGQVAHQPLAVLGEGDDRREHLAAKGRAFGRGDDGRAAALKVRCF